MNDQALTPQAKGVVGNRKSKSPVDTAVDELRRIAMVTPEGELLGSEDELVEQLKVARVTVRQAARLLEREGLLRVRRGIKGGYFATRPSIEMVESIVCGYLNTLGVDARLAGVASTALWVEVLREASKADRAAATELVESLTKQIHKLGPDPTIEAVGRAERESRTAIFKLIDGTYIEILFRINAAFARQHLNTHTQFSDAERHAKFVRDWKRSKLLEFDAIAEGDEIMAILAAMKTRKLWMDLGQPIKTN